MELIAAHMVVDGALQRAIIARCIAAGVADEPDAAVHDLGEIDLPDGTRRRLYLRHAADAIILDDAGQVVLITRTHEPGAGKSALPGGFMDVVNGVVETTLAAAIREAVEETGIDVALLRGARAVPVGRRLFDRPFDIREAWNDPTGTPIRRGEIFAVSTRGIGFRLAGNLANVRLQAGDDAKAVRVARVAELRPEWFAVPDHLVLIELAVRT
jgi:8-oxo-dGTP pyrophosphatase MutT (NUDIX family)